MKYAEKINFLNGREESIAIGRKWSGVEVTRIEVTELEYENHTELLIKVYSGSTIIATCWNTPAIITYTFDLNSTFKGV